MAAVAEEIAAFIMQPVEDVDAQMLEASQRWPDATDDEFDQAIEMACSGLERLAASNAAEAGALRAFADAKFGANDNRGS
jgi:hypothetical protein